MLTIIIIFSDCCCNWLLLNNSNRIWLVFWLVLHIYWASNLILVNKFLGIQSNYTWWIKKIFILSVSKISFNYVWCLLLQYCAFIYFILSFLLWLFSWELSVLLWQHGGKVPAHVDTEYHWPKTGACCVLQTCSWYFLSGFFLLLWYELICQGRVAPFSSNFN